MGLHLSAARRPSSSPSSPACPPVSPPVEERRITDIFQQWQRPKAPVPPYNQYAILQVREGGGETGLPGGHPAGSKLGGGVRVLHRGCFPPVPQPPPVVSSLSLEGFLAFYAEAAVDVREGRDGAGGA